MFITLYGELGETGAIMLDDKKNNFEAGKYVTHRTSFTRTSADALCSKDEFVIECPSVGDLSKILIAHNNKGSAPGWFLDHILVEDMNVNRIYEFPCNRWLATDEDDGQISRYLYPKAGDGKPQATAGKSLLDRVSCQYALFSIGFAEGGKRASHDCSFSSHVVRSYRCACFRSSP